MGVPQIFFSFQLGLSKEFGGQKNTSFYGRDANYSFIMSEAVNLFGKVNLLKKPSGLRFKVNEFTA